MSRNQMFSRFVFASVVFFIVPSFAHSQILVGGGSYTSDLSFKEGGRKYSSGGGTNLLVGLSILPALIIVPSLEVSFESDSFQGKAMSVEARSLNAEIGFGLPFAEIYAKFGSGSADITRKSEADQRNWRGHFSKERYGIELGVHYLNVFFEQGRTSVGDFSGTPRLFGIKVRIPILSEPLVRFR